MCTRREQFKVLPREWAPCVHLHKSPVTAPLHARRRRRYGRPREPVAGETHGACEFARRLAKSSQEAMASQLDVRDSRLAEYEVLEQIGKGAFGAAWVIQTRRKPNHRFVLKKVRLARQSERQRFMSRQEMHLVAALRHPFVAGRAAAVSLSHSLR